MSQAGCSEASVIPGHSTHLRFVPFARAPQDSAGKVVHSADFEEVSREALEEPSVDLEKCSGRPGFNFAMLICLRGPVHLGPRWLPSVLCVELSHLWNAKVSRGTDCLGHELQ